MSSFRELEAIAAKRAAEAQSKQASERAERIRKEAEAKARADQEARLRAQQEREAIVAREQRKRRDAELKAEDERKRKERAERIAKQQQEEARGKITSSSPMMIQARKFVDAKKKAMARAGSSAEESTGRKKRGGRNGEYDNGQDWRAEERASTSRGSTLTREEKRLKAQAAMLGLTEPARPNKRKRAKGKTAVKAPQAVDLIPVGLVKRDHRSIDEIERDLHRAKAASGLSKGLASDVMGRGSGGQVNVPSTSASSSTKTVAKLRGTQPPSRINHLGLSPADYLPGAPLRVGIVQPPAKKEAKVVISSKRETKAPAPASLPPQGPPKRETARDRFIRQEDERKRQRSQLAGASQRFEEDFGSSDEEGDEEEEEGSSVLYDDDDDDDEHGKAGADFREEIWKMFGRNRKDYVNQQDDSDDDMEADMQSVAREEARSTRIARLEDEREARELQRRAAAKAAKKAGR